MVLCSLCFHEIVILSIIIAELRERLTQTQAPWVQSMTFLSDNILIRYKVHSEPIFKQIIALLIVIVVYFRYIISHVV